MYSRMVVPKEIFEFSIIIIANVEKRKYVNMHIQDLSKTWIFRVQLYFSSISSYISKDPRILYGW